MSKEERQLAKDVDEFLPAYLVVFEPIPPRSKRNEEDPYRRAARLRSSILAVLQGPHAAVTLKTGSPIFTVLLPFFLNRTETEWSLPHLNYGDSYAAAESTAVSALRHPSCPSALLSQACRNKNLYYAYIASQSPHCPDEDAVYAQLRLNGEPQLIADYISGARVD